MLKLSLVTRANLFILILESTWVGRGRDVTEIDRYVLLQVKETFGSERQRTLRLSCISENCMWETIGSSDG